MKNILYFCLIPRLAAVCPQSSLKFYIMAIMTASIVCFTGTIGFIGLVAPHVVRIIIGSDNKFVIPISMTFGALLLVFADYLAFAIVGLPVGLITSMIGSPIFLLLILWQRKGYGAIY